MKKPVSPDYGSVIRADKRISAFEKIEQILPFRQLVGVASRQHLPDDTRGARQWQNAPDSQNDMAPVLHTTLLPPQASDRRRLPVLTR